jgi:predicted RNA-binding Zn-ribbon protein involved in translation (DUF1610 family)
MTEPRQKSIGITPQEKARLDKAKELYEKETGDRGDWGKFLGVASILALAALGIYKLARSNRSKPVVECPDCGVKFPLAYLGNPPPVVHVQCPECGQELVVDLRH